MRLTSTATPIIPSTQPALKQNSIALTSFAAQTEGDYALQQPQFGMKNRLFLLPLLFLLAMATGGLKARSIVASDRVNRNDAGYFDSALAARANTLRTGQKLVKNPEVGGGDSTGVDYAKFIGLVEVLRVKAQNTKNPQDVLKQSTELYQEVMDILLPTMPPLFQKYRPDLQVLKIRNDMDSVKVATNVADFQQALDTLKVDWLKYREDRLAAFQEALKNTTEPDEQKRLSTAISDIYKDNGAPADFDRTAAGLVKDFASGKSRKFEYGLNYLKGLVPSGELYFKLDNGWPYFGTHIDLKKGKKESPQYLITTLAGDLGTLSYKGRFQRWLNSGQDQKGFNKSLDETLEVFRNALGTLSVQN